MMDIAKKYPNGHPVFNEAFEKFYETMYGYFYRIADNYLYSIRQNAYVDHEAEDLVGIMFVAAISALRNWEPGGGAKVWSYMVSGARNAMRKMLQETGIDVRGRCLYQNRLLISFAVNKLREIHGNREFTDEEIKSVIDRSLETIKLVRGSSLVLSGVSYPTESRWFNQALRKMQDAVQEVEV